MATFNTEVHSVLTYTPLKNGSVDLPAYCTTYLTCVQFCVLCQRRRCGRRRHHRGEHVGRPLRDVVRAAGGDCGHGGRLLGGQGRRQEGGSRGSAGMFKYDLGRKIEFNSR